MNIILVPTDFSEAAKNALNYAINIAHKAKASIILLNAYSLPKSGSAVMIDVSDVLRTESLKKLKEEEERVADILNDTKITSVSMNGFLIASIVKAVKDYNASLIVMGTTGASGLKGAFVGSNTSSLIKIDEINVPIIAVPKDYKNLKIANIAVSADLSHISSSKVFRPLKMIMNGDKPHISIINVSENLINTDPSKFVNDALDIDDMFFGTEHSFKFIENKDIEKGILDFAQKDHSDLLVVVSRKRSFFEDLFHKSISKKLTMHSPTPIMVLND